jgi:hypothetical protein
LLSPGQRAAILELGSRGSGGQFDVGVMSELLTAGYIEIRSDDRRLVLTARGREAYSQLSKTAPGG